MLNMRRMGSFKMMEMMFFMLSVMSKIAAEEMNAGCASHGKYDPEEVTEGWGNIPATSNQLWKLTTVFKPEQKFTMTDMTELKLPVSAVTRVTDFDEDGTQDLLVATDGQVFFYRQNSGQLEPPVPVTANSVPIDTGVRGNKKTGFAYTDITGDGHPDVILTAKKRLVYYPSVMEEGKIKFSTKISLGKIDENRFDVGDWNRDGLPDVITGQSEGEFNYYPNVGSSTVPRFDGKKKALNLGYMAYNRYPRILDLNKDGKMDLLYSINWGYFGMCFQGKNVNFHEARLKLQSGQGINVRSEYKEHQAPEVADFNGDGIVDLITSGEKGDVLIFYGVDVIGNAQNEIRNMIESQASDLGRAMNSDESFYNLIYKKNRKLQEFVRNVHQSSEAERENVYQYYAKLVRDFPQYFTRQSWEKSTLTYFAGYVWIIMLESRPNNASNRADLASLTNQTSYDHGLFRDYGIFLINNDKAPLHRTKLIYDFFRMKNPVYYSLCFITQKDFLHGKPWKYNAMRESGVNIFTGGNYGENSFPGDCSVCEEANRSPLVMQFLVVLAHEVGHNELDQPKAGAYRRELFVRKYQILARSTGETVVWKSPVTYGYDAQNTKQVFKENGWWDGQGAWGTAMDDFFSSRQGKDYRRNSIRNMLGYLVRNPQESFATLSNQYFSDSKLMLDFAVERTQRGHPTNLDWFLLVAEYYSLGGNQIPMFVISSGGDMSHYTATLRRNEAGYITGVTVASDSQPPPYVYNFTVDDKGFVTGVTTQ